MAAKAAEAGDARAANQVGQILAARGAIGEAERWFRRSAEGGDAEGANNYAVLLHRRNADLRDVLRWLKVAADGGIPDAALNLTKLSGGPT